MEITIQQLVLTNFKGARSRKETFTGKIGTIMGANGTGKTTLVDAFMWLLFNKDSQGNASFEIKTLDADNKPIHKLDHEVSAVLFVDGIRNELRKTYREKWVKPRGQADEELQGHETLYYWNEVPMKKGEYDARIASLINEDLFKLITSPMYFNSLHWEKRRKMLEDMAGRVSVPNIFLDITTPANEKRMNELLDVLTTGKKTTEYKKELANKKNRIKQEIQDIPARIDEAERSKPDPIDLNILNAKLAEINAEITSIDQALQTGSSAQQEYRKRINQASEDVDNASLTVRKIARQITDKHSELTANEGQEEAILLKRIQTAEQERNLVEADLHTTLKQVERLRESVDLIRANWKEENAKQFDRQSARLDSICPTCKQELPATDIEEQVKVMAEHFANEKQRRLDKLSDEGKSIRAKIDVLEKQHLDLQERSGILLKTVIELKNDLKALQVKPKQSVSLDEMLVGSAELNAAKTALVKAQEALQQLESSKPDEDANIAEYRQRKVLLQDQSNNVVGTIARAGEAERIEERIKGLEAQLKILSQEIADIEGMEFAIETFEKSYITTVEKRVNAMFSKVQFKMFEQQINGGEAPACTTLINGVPWDSANNAAKINAGLDIINTICRHHNVFAPIWIDNAESVTHIIPTDSQCIRLYVTQPDTQPQPTELKIPISVKQPELFS